MLACAWGESKKIEVPAGSKEGGTPLFESTMNLKEIKLYLGTELLRLYFHKEGAQASIFCGLLTQLLDSLPEPLTDDEKGALFQGVSGMPFL